MPIAGRIARRERDYNFINDLMPDQAICMPMQKTRKALSRLTICSPRGPRRWMRRGALA